MPVNHLMQMLKTLVRDIETAGYESVYNFQNATVALKVDTSALIEFANMYFDCYFDVGTHSEPQITVYASSSSIILEYLCTELPVDEKDLDKNGSIVIPLNSNMDVIFQQDIEGGSNCSAYHVVDKFKRNIIILVSECDEPGKHMLMRTVRTFVKLLLLERGMLLFHAACIVKDGYGIGFTGDKLAGKTTTLITALLNCNCDFLANDKVFLDYINGYLTMYGLPVSLGIRVGTIHLFPTMQSLLGKASALHSDNNILSEKELENPRTRIYVSPRYLASMLKCSIVPCARVKCFVIPEFSRSTRESKLIHLTLDETKKFLLTQHLSEPFPHQPYWNKLVNPGNGKLHDNVETVIDRISNDIPVYKLIQNDKTNGDSVDILNKLWG